MLTKKTPPSYIEDQENQEVRQNLDSPALQYRFECYVKSCLSLGAYLPLGAIFQRFCRAVGIKVSERQRLRYFAYITKNADKLGLRFFKADKKLLVTSEKSPYPTFKKPDSTFTVAKKLKEILISGRKAALNVYEVLAGLLGKSRYAVEKVVQKLKNIAKQAKLYFYFEGKKLKMRLRGKAQKIPATYLTLPTIYIAKELILKRNTENGGWKMEEKQHASVPRFDANKLRRKSFALMRKLKSLFYDNVKVNFTHGTVFNFCEWALNQGYREDAIEACFEKALIQRHQDATDWGLNHHNPSFKFEVSSTVTLAKENLQTNDSMTLSERWQSLKNWLNNKTQANDSQVQMDQRSSNEPAGWAEYLREKYPSCAEKIEEYVQNGWNSIPKTLRDDFAWEIQQWNKNKASQVSEEKAQECAPSVCFESNDWQEEKKCVGQAEELSDEEILRAKGYSEDLLNAFTKLGPLFEEVIDQGIDTNTLPSSVSRYFRFWSNAQSVLEKHRSGSKESLDFSENCGLRVKMG